MTTSAGRARVLSGTTTANDVLRFRGDGVRWALGGGEGGAVDESGAGELGAHAMAESADSGAGVGDCRLNRIPDGEDGRRMNEDALPAVKEPLRAGAVACESRAESQQHERRLGARETNSSRFSLGQRRGARHLELVVRFFERDRLERLPNRLGR